MNRPVKSQSSKSSFNLEKRVTVLTYLVILQIFLLAAIFILVVRNSAPHSSPDEMASNVSEMESSITDAEMAEVKPVVKEPEKGPLPPEVPLERPVRIEILNGCGVPKLAAKYESILRSKGYDVRSTGNADNHRYLNTLILDRTNLSGQALKLAGTMGVAGEFVTMKPDPRLVDIDLTVILGKDYPDLLVKP